MESVHVARDRANKRIMDFTEKNPPILTTAPIKVTQYQVNRAFLSFMEKKITRKELEDVLEARKAWLIYQKWMVEAREKTAVAEGTAPDGVHELRVVERETGRFMKDVHTK